MSRLCTCGQPILSHKLSVKYCSEECRKLGHYTPVAAKERECGACHVTFMGNGNVKYCSAECKTIAQYEQMRKWHAANRAPKDRSGEFIYKFTCKQSAQDLSRDDLPESEREALEDKATPVFVSLREEIYAMFNQCQHLRGYSCGFLRLAVQEQGAGGNLPNIQRHAEV